MRRSSHLLAAQAALLLLAVAGCSATPEIPFALELPELEVDASFDPAGGVAAPALQAAGRGPAGEPGEDAEGAPRAVRCRVLYLAEPPATTDAFRSLASRAVAAADLSGTEPVVVTPELTAGALFTAGEEADRWADAALAGPHVAVVADRSVALPTGASLRVGVTSEDFVEDPRDWLDEFPDRGPVPRRVGVDVNSSAGGISLALEVTDLDPEGERALREELLEEPDRLPAPAPPAHTLRIRCEAVAVDAAPSAGAPVLILMDSPFNGGNGTTIALFVEEIPPRQASTTADEAEAVVALARAERLLASAPLTDAGRRELVRGEALRAFRDRGGRSALLLLAEESGATLTAELALLASDEDLVALGQEAFGEAGAAALEPSVLGWKLDSTAWTILARGTLEETLPEELEGAFLRRGGAAARFPDIVLDMVAAANGSLEALDEAIVRENRIALEDASAAARVAGHDWLAERGEQVPDYDPRADRKERRTALAAAEEQR